MSVFINKQSDFFICNKTSAWAMPTLWHNNFFICDETSAWVSTPTLCHCYFFICN